jgi:hypothetical protein
MGSLCMTPQVSKARPGPPHSWFWVHGRGLTQALWASVTSSYARSPHAKYGLFDGADNKVPEIARPGRIGI